MTFVSPYPVTINGPAIVRGLFFEIVSGGPNGQPHVRLSATDSKESVRVSVSFEGLETNRVVSVCNGSVGAQELMPVPMAVPNAAKRASMIILFSIA